MRKIISALLVLCVLLCAVACTKTNSKEEHKTSDGYTDGVIKGSSEHSSFLDGIFPDSVSKEAKSEIRYGAYDGEIISGGADISDYGYQEIINAGTLTASEYKDLLDIEAWKKLVNDNNWYEIAKARNIFTMDLVKVRVVCDNAGVFNQTVELRAGSKTLFTAKTDINGVAILAYNVRTKDEKPTSVAVGQTVQDLEGKNEITVEIADDGEKIEKLDLMLMIDTTGSMGDELRYITEELKDVVKRAVGENKAIRIRTSVNFYRDETDEYVVKYFDFREDIEECIKQLSEQSANGGGDYPEAVHTALDNAVNDHTWDEDAVKLCFLVLDAPPHSEEEVQGVNESLVKSLNAAAAKGIRIIPVLSSGANKDTEYLCRSFAITTGGTFLYLTDDSGIGRSHLKPDVPEQKVEYLNECMLRVICEYCGLEYTAPSTQKQQ